ncbi:MAG: type I-D CRISPR-associated protein Cas7/Csc2 [Caldilineales bacterium]|nr:type I-D CRISPR-associated protein Cas7/Csc2 [Caldilineales bacterium]
MSTLIQYQDRLLRAYTTFPRGHYVSLILVRKTESETLFRTEGAEGDLSKDFVRAGAVDDEIIQRVVITKRKQTAVERRTGRELLRDHNRLYLDAKSNAVCALNTTNTCEHCIDCMVYGYAVGGGGAQKSRVITDDAFSILSSGVVSDSRQGNALYDTGTMRNPETGEASQAIFTVPYVKPETHFLEIETLKDVTLGEWVYILGNVLRSTRYGAVSSRQGRIKNMLAGVVFSNCEIFSNLELTQTVYDQLKTKDPELNFPLRDTDVLTAVSDATTTLIKNVATASPLVLGLAECAAIHQAIVQVYRDDERVGALLGAIEQGYDRDEAKRQAGHATVLQVLEAAEAATQEA